MHGNVTYCILTQYYITLRYIGEVTFNGKGTLFLSVTQLKYHYL